MTTTVEKLDDEQVESFDTNYLEHHSGWDVVKACIDKNFPDGEFSFLDVGGGNGVFADRILATYGKATGTVVDNSRYLLDRNGPNERKSLIECGVEDMKAGVGDNKYDIIFFNWILHHLVTRSYSETRGFISSVISSTRDMLTEQGMISVLENCYDSVATEGLPSRIIFHALSSKILASATKKMGANTSGVGVCYLSEALWRETFQKNGFTIESCVHTSPLSVSTLKKVMCTITGIDVVHFYCKK